MPRDTFEDITAVQQMISSCTGAILTSLLVTPFDVVKIRLQSQKVPLVKGKCFLYCNGLMDHLCTCLNGPTNNGYWYKRKVPGHYKGTVDAMMQISRHEGFRSLWSGLPPTLVMAVPATVVYFSCYEHFRNLFGYSAGLSSQNDWWKPIMAGASARTLAVFAISPLEMVRTKIQSEQLKYSQVLTAVQHTVKEGGMVKSLYRGFTPTLLRDVPFSALYWFGYEGMKSIVIKKSPSHNMTSAESFCCGAVSGGIAAVLTLPFDVIKTHRQISIGETRRRGSQEVTSTLRLIIQLYYREGAHALFAGLVPRVVKVAPACAIMISSYEYFKNFFKARNRELRENRMHSA
ncbi:probable mitochondrial glutathione transporter SLC25A40 [Ostrea edulis]|uniref:probable mitochondrial glutathione transporter SLC25A40 n=1 Tax=Ostrea edulis TaxID=37623 RepID=UPI0024AEBC16|nr:probable mitochondrial glutathione transporter SLC25A40 [Ostrea edulis]